MKSFEILLIISLASLVNPMNYAGTTKVQGKARLSMRIAHAICKDTKNFAKFNKIQNSNNDLSPSGKSQNVKEKKSNENHCSVILWSTTTTTTTCNPSGRPSKSCSKFELTNCTPNEQEVREFRKVDNDKNNKNRNSEVEVEIQPRITGGRIANPGEVPYIAHLFHKKEHLCGGTLISPNFVLSAAHCFRNPTVPTQEVVIILGDYQTIVNDTTEIRRVIKQLYIHENYSFTPLMRNDIALIQLDSPVELSTAIQPTILPPTDFTAKGVMYVSGWGKDEKGQIQNKLKIINLRIITDEECAPQFDPGVIVPEKICTRSPQQSFCVGDSGGPMVLRTKQSRCFISMGIISELVNCGLTGFPGIYVEISKYIGWILSKIDPRIPFITKQNSDVASTTSSISAEFPYQVRILRDGQTICGGSIYSAFYILTSASCIVQEKEKNNIAKITIIAGDYDALKPNEQTEQSRSITDIIIHESFEKVSYANDIALLKLKTPIEIKDAIYEAKIATSSSPQDNMFMTGWGFMQTVQPSQGNSNTLQKVRMRIISEQECRSKYGCALYAQGNQKHNFLCAVPTNVAGSCYGDFGAPLASGLPNGDYFLFGLLSYRIWCDSSLYPTVFTNVSVYDQWLHENGNENVTAFASPFELHHQVLISVQQKPICTGIIINSDYILSTASCFIENTNQTSITTLKVFAGKIKLNETESTQQEAIVQFITLHESYDRTSGENDIALLKLLKPLLLNRGVQPAIIPQIDFSASRGGQTSGWGLGQIQGQSQNQNQNPQQLLHKMFPFIISDSQCQDNYNKVNSSQTIVPGMMCTVPRESQFCITDSGAPITQPLTNVFLDKCFLLVGFLSQARQCLKTALPPIYTEASKYRNWIEETISPKSPSPTVKRLQLRLRLQVNQCKRNTNKKQAIQTQAQTIPRISGGFNALPNEFPFHVQIIKSGITICGGVILNDYYVLTSAYCMEKEDLTKLSILAGVQDTSDRANAQDRQIGAVIFHPEFDIITKANDLALLQIASPFVFNTFVQKVTLAGPNYILQRNTPVTVTGWGRGFGGTNLQPTKLQKIVLNTISRHDCWQAYGCGIYSLEGRIICATVPGTMDKGTCEGDEGGPLTIKLENRTTGNPYLLIGIASFRIGCGEGGYPSVFTRISRYYDWLRATDPFNGDITAKANEIPYQVIVQKYGVPSCGGTILNANYILSSAHCFFDRTQVSADDINIVAGKRILKGRERGEQTRYVKSLFIHENYRRFSGANNIALLFLSQPLQLNDAVQPAIMLAPSNAPVRGQALVSGWYILNGTRKHLEKLVVATISERHCKDAYQGSAQRITDEFLCSSTIGNLVCVGDSGGPMTQTLEGFNPNNCRSIVGVATEHCGLPGFPRIYTTVSKYNEWIKSKIDATQQTHIQVGRSRNLGFVGGIDVKPNEFPYHVRILSRGRTICSGAILNPFYIITSAFCVVGEQPFFTTIIAGDHKISTNEPSEQVRNVVEFTIHEKFDNITQANDIAILQLDSALVFSKVIDDILPASKELTSPEEFGDLILTGWKVFNFDDPSSDPLKKLVVGEISTEDCRKSYGCALYSMEDKIVCAEGLNIPAAGGFCRGAYGSPLALNTSDDGRFILYGIASFRLGCNDRKYPSVFTWVGAYAHWIGQNYALGTIVPPNALPYQVLITLRGLIPRCSGAIISDYYILSSAFCMQALTRINISEIVIITGRNNIDSVGLHEQIRKVFKITLHEGFLGSNRENDIALIELADKLFTNEFIFPALISNVDNATGDAIVSGWAIPGVPINELRQAKFPLISDSECRQAYVGTPFNLTQNQLCTSIKPVTNCFSDFGSPLTKVVENKCYRLIGITSFPNDCHNIRRPSIYTKVAKYVDWIQTKLSPGSPLKNICHT